MHDQNVPGTLRGTFLAVFTKLGNRGYICKWLLTYGLNSATGHNFSNEEFWTTKNLGSNPLGKFLIDPLSQTP